jgi:hypothetical protein
MGGDDEAREGVRTHVTVLFAMKMMKRSFCYIMNEPTALFRATTFAFLQYFLFTGRAGIINIQISTINRSK